MKKLGILLLISFCLLGCQPRDEVPTPEKVSEIEISKSYTFDEQLRYEIVKSTVTNKIEPTNKNNTYRSIKPKQDENQFIDVVLKTKNLSKKEYVLKDIYQGTFVINHQSYKASLAIENLKSVSYTHLIVLQDTHLFTGTIADNIRYGKLNATMDEVIEAAKLANAHSFIKRLPDGYNTMLSGDGANLSQGQRQLLAIARAAIANPPVLILDEATSSIDTRTEKLIEKGMDLSLIHIYQV